MLHNKHTVACSTSKILVVAVHKISDSRMSLASSMQQ
jgi:hypothetical protein